MELMSLREAIKHLENLPTTAAMADELVSMGITGTREEPLDCALGTYFRCVTGESVAVTYVTHAELPGFVTEALLYPGATLHSSGVIKKLPASTSIPASAKIGRLAKEFDEGLHPKLDAEALALAGSGCPVCQGVNSYNCSVCNPTKG